MTGRIDVLEQIRTLIVSNAIAPGERVNIDQLSRRLGVSQTPVREALQHLEGDRLVVRDKNRGYTTTALLDERGLANMFEVRLLIEPWTASTVAVDRVGNPGRRMADEIEAYLAAQADAQNPRAELVAHDVRFHEIMLAAVDNPFLLDAYRSLHAHLHVFRLYPQDFDGTATVGEHVAIATAIAECRPRDAADAMRAHLGSALERFRSGMSGTAGAAGGAGLGFTTSVLGAVAPAAGG